MARVKSAVTGEGIPTEDAWLLGGLDCFFLKEFSFCYMVLGLSFFLFSSFCLVASTAFSCKIFLDYMVLDDLKTR
jgi:hypothetical protein